jgi:transposase
MTTWLLNAAHIKAVPGRKSDVRDAEWIAQLLEHGLVSPSFVPEAPVRRLRNLTRYRLQLQGDRTRDAGRLEKLLEDASIKISAVASNITGTSSRAMLSALVDGQRDPMVMADLARTKLRRKIPDLVEALTGHFDDHHALIVGQLLARIAATEQAVADLDAHLEVAMAPWAHEIDLLTTIPGVGRLVAWTFIAETGGDMSRFPSAGHLASWAGVAPAMHESAGRRQPVGTRHGNRFLTSMLVEAAQSASHTKDTYLASQFAHLTSRRGHNRAAVAVAHSILVSAYWTRPTTTSDRAGSPNTRPTRPAPAAWSTSSRHSATPSCSTPPPDSPSPSTTIRASARSCRAPASGHSRVSHVPACSPQPGCWKGWSARRRPRWWTARSAPRLAPAPARCGRCRRSPGIRPRHTCCRTAPASPTSRRPRQRRGAHAHP